MNTFPNVQHSVKLWTEEAPIIQDLVIHINLIETCMQTCFGWMALNATVIGRFYNFNIIFPVMICLLQCMRKILDNGKGEVRLSPELKGLVWCSTVLTREMSPGRSHVTRGRPAHSTILQPNVLHPAGQQINISKGIRVKAMCGQRRRCGPGYRGTGAWIHTRALTSQCVRLDRPYLLQDSVNSQDC